MTTDKNKFIIKSDDVAVPEVHTKEPDDTEHWENRNDKDIDIVYESVAIPEIHIKNKN